MPLRNGIAHTDTGGPVQNFRDSFERFRFPKRADGLAKKNKRFVECQRGFKALEPFFDGIKVIQKASRRGKDNVSLAIELADPLDTLRFDKFKIRLQIQIRQVFSREFDVLAEDRHVASGKTLPQR